MGEDWRALNRANWDERTGAHLAPGGYDLSSHRAGRGRLDAIVEAELGDVTGLRVLHLQCHLGDDSVAIAQRGAAEVVGVDFSPPAIAAARALAAECGVRGVRFVESDVFAAPAALPDEAASFDVVFMSWGTIWWYPDLPGWARVVAGFLKPGGALIFADAHPASMVFDDAGRGAGDGMPGWEVPYFERAGRVWDDPGDYMNAEARLRNSRTMTWLHPLGDITEAIVGAGLALRRLREHPAACWPMYRGLVRDAADPTLWRWPGEAWLPLGLSITAVKGK